MANSLKVEIFAVGKWNGLDFTIEDLKLMSAAFNKLRDVHKVPLKMGHNDEQPFTDGQPALGWVGDVFVEGDKLMAEFIDIPDVVFSAMQSNLYKHVSVELDMGVEHKGDFYPWVLSGVALLGADIPAVNTLSDLQAYMGKELHYQKRAVFTASSKKARSKTMSDHDKDAEVESLKAQLAASKGENEKLLTSNLELERKLTTQKAEFKALEVAETHRKQVEERGTLEQKLDTMVKEKKITPFTRDDLLRDYDEAQDKSVVKFAVEKLEKTIDANPAYFGAEQARQRQEKLDNEEGKRADEIVVERTREYMAKHGEKDFTTAKRQVLQADLDLANRYTKGEA